MRGLRVLMDPPRPRGGAVALFTRGAQQKVQLLTQLVLGSLEQLESSQLEAIVSCRGWYTPSEGHVELAAGSRKRPIDRVPDLVEGSELKQG